MLRVTTIQNSHQCDSLRLEGKLMAEWVLVLEEACSRLDRSRGQVTLDLSGLSFADSAGLAALVAAVESGIRIGACSGYVRQLLEPWCDHADQH